ncbi:MAG: hypothetical protein ACLRQY_11820 [[Clostridium] leptum]
MIQSGVPVDILYFRKVVRDSLNASPRYLRSDDTPEKRLARQKEYIATVRQVQEAVEKVQTVQEAMGVFESLIIGGGTVSVFLVNRRRVYQATQRAG